MEPLILEGSISVKAALEAGRREVFEILCDRKPRDRNRNYLLNLARKNGVKITECDRKTVDVVANGSSHGGIVARVGERRYESVTELLGHHHPFLALLDGIEDPYNFGGALRSLYAAGVNGILVPERNWCNAAGVVAKSSAGASEFLNIAPIADWDEAMRAVHDRGIRILCAERKDSESLYETDLSGDLLLVFGGEMRGISAKILKYSDKNVHIPYAGNFRNALSANSAAAIFAFEVLRRRIQTDG